MSKMTEECKKEWDDLYRYVKFEILGYSDDMKLPRFLILRLKGLNQGKFCANNKTKPLANYSFNVILTTFKINKFTILNAFKFERKFKDEKHKINYMMAIIENNINDVVNKIDRIEKSTVKGENLDIDIYSNKAEYKPKSKEIKNSRLKGLL